MSKVAAPRPRHIALRIEAPRPVSRRALAQAVRLQARTEGWPDAAAPQLTRYDFPHAAVRVEHDRATAARGLLARIVRLAEPDGPVAVRLETLATSGTLAALSRRLGILKARDA